MNFRLATGATAAAWFILFAPGSLAHHSLAGQFNTQKLITLSGVVTEVDWVNPHIYLQLKVAENKNSIATWRLEGVPVAMARKAGLTKAKLMGNGETVTVEVYPARDGTPHLGFMMKLKYPDGRFFQFVADTASTPAATPATTPAK